MRSVPHAYGQSSAGTHERFSKGAYKSTAAVLLTIFAAGLVGCKAATPSTSSLIAIDCSRNRGFLPLADLNASLHGQIAALNLSVDPDKGNPLLNVIDIQLQALPRGMAVDFQDGVLLALADNGVTTGTLVLVDETSFQVTSIPLPTGSRPSETDGIVFDPADGTALVSMTDAPNCPVLGQCTGVSIFNMSTHKFGPLLQSQGAANNFGVNFIADTSLGTSDDTDPTLLAVNLAKSQVCSFDDANVTALKGDTEGVGVDPTTNIWVFGNFNSSSATVVNLYGSSFTKGSNCSLNEGGKPPNSINFNTGTGAQGMPGVVVNPLTHEALMTATSSSELALLDLPSLPVRQISASRVSSVNSEMPNEPDGAKFAAATFPYGDAVDVCHNLGYVLDSSRNFLAQIDLSKFRKSPISISLPLPSGSCFSTPTSFKCGNGSGVKFFPLPQS